MPFNGLIGATRVGFVDGQYVLNPTATQLAQSKLDLVVAGTESAVLMVESEAQQLTEEQMLGAVVFGHEGGKAAINAIKALTAQVGTTPWDWQAEDKDDGLLEQVHATVGSDIASAYQIPDKAARQAAMSAAREKLYRRCCQKPQKSRKPSALRER